jgi:catechol 2,3-dioxygenase-like lactoylglutathione lyase family enzyme
VLIVGAVVIRVDDMARQVAFWSAALGYEPRDDADDDFTQLLPPNGRGPRISLDRWHADLHNPPRLHLDLYAKNQGAEVERLVALGATEVEWSRKPPDADFVILADPEGNRFCVIDASDRVPDD